MRQFASPSVGLDGKSILVTGGTGSFGRAFVRSILEKYRPRRLVVYSRDELKQFEMAQVFDDKRYPCIRYFIGDVRDEPRLEMALSGIEYVVHAAALKQVSTAEYNPFECIHTNVIGAENVVRASMRAGVRKVIALSTDKAANPINLYGASKLAADKIFIAANQLAGSGGPRFAVVRYGNVVGSRGSVVPFFRKLVAEGADHIPITHKEMTRFWITLDQGIGIVCSSLALMRGGEIYVPKIPSMRMVDLAEAIAPGVPHRMVGIRPGEKLHEVMVTEDDALQTLELEDRYVIIPGYATWLREDYLAHGGRPVAERFAYASNTNSEWLTPSSFMAMLEPPGGA